MAIIRSITFSFLLLIGAALQPPSFASDDELLLRELRESLAKVVSTQMAEQFRSHLGETGLSPADVDKIVAELENAVTTCFVDSAVEYAQTLGTPLADLIIEFDGYKAINVESAAFEELLIPCLYAARAAAGIEPDLDAT